MPIGGSGVSAADRDEAGETRTRIEWALLLGGGPQVRSAVDEDDARALAAKTAGKGVAVYREQHEYIGPLTPAAPRPADGSVGVVPGS